MAESYFLAKVYRQHNSLVIAVPQPVCVTLGLKPGHHILFQWQQAEGKFKFKKFIPEGAKDADDSRRGHSTDTGGKA